MELLPFLERRARLIALLLVIFASARIIATYRVFNHTFDEPIQIACGMEWLDKGTYTYEPQHPPLARIAGALGPFLMGISSQGIAGKPQTAGKDGVIEVYPAEEGIAILYSGHRYDTTLAMARLGILPFFWIACGVVYLWGERYFTRALAVIAVFLFSFVPTVLAHSGLATTDMALTAFIGAAFLAGLIWVERPTNWHALYFGLFTALAVLSKLSALAFLPVAILVTLAWYWSTGKLLTGSDIKNRLPSFALAILTGALVIWIGYRFSFGKVSFASIPLPAPELFAGIDAVSKHDAFGHWSYLLGQRSPLGFWYFYSVALAVKTPLAFLALLMWGIVLAFRKTNATRHLWIPLAFALAIHQVGMFGHINIGIRHILPVYIGFSLLAAAAAVNLLERARLGAVAAVLFLWLAGSSLLGHPDYLAYFNALAGSEPEKILVDSDLDWGQDIKRLSARLHQLGVKEVNFPQFIIADLEHEHGFPKINQTFDFHHPAPGYYAAGATFWKSYRFGLSRENDVDIFPDQIPPTERIGKGMFLWVIPTGKQASAQQLTGPRGGRPLSEAARSGQAW